MRKVASGWPGLGSRFTRAPQSAAYGLTIALSWLTLMGLPEGGVLPEGFRRTVSAWGKASVISLALSLLGKLGNLPLCCLPQPHHQE